MALKGSSGASLGGGVVHTRRKKPRQLNTVPCSVCGAGKGQPCFESVPGRGLRDLPRVHVGQGAKHS
ncbi:zinc finger domain-containing protein [Paeniglutamicibacter cryotolerans]|uniref:zinc finger domain-containing protein n=1 Tax=Paeniglutamicibacter cryotolerans TaxID=670079 RepID=UPI003CD07E36